jgi:lia operon protein LiaG
MEAGDLTAEKINLVTSTGNIKINQLQTKELDIKGTTGKVNIDGCIVETATIKTTTGDVSLRNASGNFNIETSTGKVLLDAKEFENRNVTIGTSTGSISLQLPSTAQFTFVAKSSTGRLKSDFPISTNDKKQITGKIGTSSSMVDLHSSTGSITISKK